MNDLSTREQLLASMTHDPGRDRPTREELKAKRVNMVDAAPVLRDYVNGVLMTREEWAAE